MMLKHISEFDTNTRLAALFRNWVAICPDTGAFLSASRGRAKSGNGRRYVLIVPITPLSQRTGFFDSYDWDNKRRKSIRAWSDDEAIELANKKLEKILGSNKQPETTERNE